MQESGWTMNQNDDSTSTPVAATPQPVAPRPVGLGGTYGLDRVHVDAAHVG
jgi:hypothetical protein